MDSAVSQDSLNSEVKAKPALESKNSLASDIPSTEESSIVVKVRRHSTMKIADSPAATQLKKDVGAI